MQYGICNLSIVPLRFEASDQSELVSQLLYGDHFKVLKQRKKWSRIRIAYDNYEGWIDNKQYLVISESDYKKISKAKPKYSADLIEFVRDKNDHLYPIPLGCSLNGLKLLKHSFDGNSISGIKKKGESYEYGLHVFECTISVGW